MHCLARFHGEQVISVVQGRVYTVVYCRLRDIEMYNVVVSRGEVVKRSLDALPVRQVVENGF